MKKQDQSLRSILGTALAATALLGTASAHACSADSEYIGSVCATAANFCPNGYFQANGQLLPISQYTALFSLLGTTYGGDGRTTFALPDLRGRSAIGVGQGPGLSNVSLGEPRGTENTTLTINQMPIHTHAATFTPTGGNISGNLQVSTQNGSSNTAAAGNYLATAVGPNRGDPGNKIYTGDGSNLVNLGGLQITGSTGGTVSVGVAGASQPVSTVPPQLGLTYCINWSGVYPSRPN